MLTLNVSNPPKARAAAMLDWLWHTDEQVLVLTEVGRSAGSQLIEQVCRAAGFAVVATDRSELGVLVVGRGVAVRPTPAEPLAVLPGRVAPVLVAAGSSELPVLGVYGAASDPVRYASAAQRARKREWLAAYQAWLVDWLAAQGDCALVLGDLNIVDPLHTDPLPYVLHEERDLYAALTGPLGLSDAYRATDPTGAGVSWVDHTGVGCRYDHALTRGLAVTACRLDHEPRVARLTDHSALRLRVGRP